MSMVKQQQGFTLIELVVVIVILGILAATALPRFVNLQTDAKVAAVQGLAGGMRGAVGLVQAKWQVAGGSGVASVAVSGGSVLTDTAEGYPTNALGGIAAALGCGSISDPGDCQGATMAGFGGTVTWTPSGVATGVTTCRAEYVSSSGTVTAVTGGC